MDKNKQFVEMQIQGAREFGELWYTMNQYVVALARSYDVDHRLFRVGLTKMALDGLRNQKIDFTADDFIKMVRDESLPVLPPMSQLAGVNA